MVDLVLQAAREQVVRELGIPKPSTPLHFEEAGAGYWALAFGLPSDKTIAHPFDEGPHAPTTKPLIEHL